jgi:hypothetical protein
MKNLAILTLVVCSLGLAQTQPDVQLPPNVRMYQPKNLTPDRAERVAGFVRNFLNLPGLFVGWDNVPHAFVIRTGKSQDMDMAEALLKRYDVPEPKVELTVYLIRAATVPPSTPDNRIPTPLQNPVPPDLKTAIDEMKGALNYDRYTLWDTILLEPKGSGGEMQGILPSEYGANNYVYSVNYGVYGGAPTEGTTVNLANFTFSLKMPQGEKEVESHIRTDVTVHEGQKLVLGKIRMMPNAHADLFLVLTTKVY